MLESRFFPCASVTAVVVCLLVAGCGTFASPTESTLTFAQMQMLNPGVDGEWILAEYPFARDVTRRSDGTIERMGFWVTDPQGTPRPLMLHFDAGGTLVRKQYGGPVVRPPQPGEVDLGF